MHFKTKVFESQNPHPLQFLLFLLSIKCCPLICYYVHVMATINEKCTFMFLLPLANFSFKLLFNLIRYVSSTLIINIFFPQIVVYVYTLVNSLRHPDQQIYY